ncbi:butyrophilin subfamily 2 member A2-like isoform X1 [Pelodiscus sinensis]|uniref:butyrophilin subfamily 2 member A2-like isoform X1 n=1 Tax=Pelodiscus sinensis TaxID=13735 RepID=UPI003F6CB4D4
MDHLAIIIIGLFFINGSSLAPIPRDDGKPVEGQVQIELKTSENRTETPLEAKLALENKILIGVVVILLLTVIVLLFFLCRELSKTRRNYSRYLLVFPCALGKGYKCKKEDPEKRKLISAEEVPKDDDKPTQGQLQAELRWRETHRYAEDITLNPDTAHPNLSIARNKKHLTHEVQPQKALPKPERFDSTVCVLGSEGFSSGKHYWEVDVESSTEWDLGVAKKSIEKKGKLSVSPKEGFWVLGLSGKDYWAKTDPWTRVMVQRKPKKIGVYLSCKESQVTFFSVTDMSVLFTFSDCSFTGEIFPFFKNPQKETTLRICSLRDE